MLGVEIQSSGEGPHIGRKVLSSGLGRLGVREPRVDVLWTLKVKKGSWIGFVKSGLSSILGVFGNLEDKRSLREDM